ncbi:hypothetical protein ACRAWF_31060 [Streptomyces sp. L7]
MPDTGAAFRHQNRDPGVPVDIRASKRTGAWDHGAFIAAATGFPAVVFTAAHSSWLVPYWLLVALGAGRRRARPRARSLPLPCALRRPVARRGPGDLAFSLFVAVGWLIELLREACCSSPRARPASWSGRSC